MHTELSKAPKLSPAVPLESKNTVQPEKKEQVETGRILIVGDSFPIDSWISQVSFKQFFYLDRDYSAIEVLKVPGYLTGRTKIDTEYDGNIHYFCIDFLKQAIKNAAFFETVIGNERTEKHLKKDREEQKKEMWLKLKNKFQAEFQRIKRTSSSLP